MNEPREPKCEACGKISDVQAIPRPGTIPGSFPALRWMCASCQYLEDHPGAARVTNRRAPKVPQEETIF